MQTTQACLPELYPLLVLPVFVFQVLQVLVLLGGGLKFFPWHLKVEDEPVYVMARVVVRPGEEMVFASWDVTWSAGP